jgi:predicted GIY-YIG superfamily endonuclease
MCKKSGIYKIVCTVNDKVYVGSAVDLNKRRREHFSALRRNRHHNKHLQNAFNRYKEKCFHFEVIFECDEENLLLEEEQQIKQYDSYNHGFNLVETPTQGNRGIKMSVEVKQRLSLAAKKRGRNSGSLTKEQVQQVRQKFFDGERIGSLANEFDIHRKTIRECVYLRSYQDIECNIEGYEEMLHELEEARVRGERPRSRGWKQSEEHVNMIKEINSKPKHSIRNLTEDQVREIRQRKENGETLKSISMDFNVNQNTISRICRYLIYTDVK